MTWKKYFNEGKRLILATSSKKCVPNANIVISLGFIGDKLLVADCQMKNTINNLKENPNICVVGGFFRLKGKVKIFSSGKYFDICARKSKKYPAKNAILIKTEKVFDLDKVKTVLL
jgi:hypothetical protein